MFCVKCGKELPDDAVFCSGCGAKMRQETTTSTTDSIKDMVKKASDTVSSTAKNVGDKINDATGGKAAEFVQTAQEKAKETAQNYSSDVKQAVGDKDVKNFFTKNKYRNSFLTAGLVIVLIIFSCLLFGKKANKIDYYLDKYGKVGEKCKIETDFYKKNKDSIISGAKNNIDENTELTYYKSGGAIINLKHQDTFRSDSSVMIILDDDMNIISKSTQANICLDGWSFTNDGKYDAFCVVADSEYENLVRIYTEKFGEGTPELPWDGELGELYNQEGMKWKTKEATITIDKYYFPPENSPKGKWIMPPIISINISRVNDK